MTLVLGQGLISTPVGDGYVITALLAEGGMGALYIAENQLGMRKAIKVIKPEIVAAYPDIAQRFGDEARAMAALSEHRNVVRLDGLGQLPDGTLYLKMEFLKGKSVAAWAHSQHDGKVPAEEVLQVIAQVVDVLDVAHRAGFVHRDLKPDNLFIAPTVDNALHTKVLDFGIVKLRTLARPRTLPSGGMGTPGYWAPEQQLAASSVDARADIYSLAVIVYELLTTRLPPPGAENQEPPPAFVTPGWWPTLRAGLSPNREERPRTVRDFLNGLTAGIENGDKRAEEVAPRLYREAVDTDSTIKYGGPLPSKPGVASQPPAMTTFGGAAGATPTTPPTARNRHGSALIAGAIVVASLTIAIAILTTRSSDATPTTQPTAPAAVDAALTPVSAPIAAPATTPLNDVPPSDAGTIDAAFIDAGIKRTRPHATSHAKDSVNDIGDF